MFIIKSFNSSEALLIFSVAFLTAFLTTFDRIQEINMIIKKKYDIFRPPETALGRKQPARDHCPRGAGIGNINLDTGYCCNIGFVVLDLAPL
jgi:hypothetical protein